MWKNLTLFGAAMLVTAVLAEVAIRLLDPALLREEDRIGLTTISAVRDESGAIRYPPHQSVRTAMLSGRKVLFDIRFRTNDRGLLDHRDYGAGRTNSQAWAFVGDSFAAGVGGDSPWIPRLRDEYGLEIYNLGIGATGIQQFPRILASEAKQLSFDEIVIIAISDDFFRPLWTPLTINDEVRICVEGEDKAHCSERPPIAFLIDPNLAESAVVTYADELRQRASYTRSTGSKLKQLLRQSHLLLFTKRLVEAIIIRQVLRSGELPKSLAALDKIRLDFPETRIRFIHVPDRYEAERKRYDFDPAAELEQRGIQYFDALSGCSLTPDHYLTGDQHPNQMGYEVLSRCVADYLELAKQH
ncbi:MAG: SGNH/GDSL hydrolase family protein [Gammaproteobacteria bacterium]|nr:SGNH/GDSL hydrolase family protein [Gammaproteobacteria bacterium]MCP5427176.1 SGNH/GDSL hydrolase family protein [Chromatiaceae bacterium]